jgi:hypothetical protein
MARPSTVFLTVILAAALAGCTMRATTSLRYAPAGAKLATPIKARLAVLPLAEGRGPRLYPSTLAHSFILYIPLFPYVRITYERLDESLAIAHREVDLSTLVDPHTLFPYAIAAAVADDLRASGLFASVTMVDDPSQVGDADLILSGRLDSTEFDNYQTSFGLSFPGIILWLLPLPAFSQSATVTASLTLQDRTHTAIWQGVAHGDASRVFVTWNNGGAPITNDQMLRIHRYGTNDLGIDPDSFWAYHAEALRSGMIEVKSSMIQTIGDHPVALGR